MRSRYDTGKPPEVTGRSGQMPRAAVVHRRGAMLVSALALGIAALTLAACGDDDGADQGTSSAAPASQTSVPLGGGQVAASGISVTGTGVVTAVPDQARFSFGVREEADTAEEALERTSEATAAVLDAIRQAGIADEDIQTQQVSIFPIHSGDAGRVTGFSAANSVSALVRELDRAGEVVDAAVDAGANEVFGPTLDISDATSFADQALGLAVDEARARAQALAEAAGVELGEIVAISEAGAPTSRPAAAPEASVESAFVPIEPGTQEVRVTVSATFAIR